MQICKRFFPYLICINFMWFNFPFFFTPLSQLFIFTQRYNFYNPVLSYLNPLPLRKIKGGFQFSKILSCISKYCPLLHLSQWKGFKVFTSHKHHSGLFNILLNFTSCLQLFLLILITNQTDQFYVHSKEDPNWDARPVSGLGIKRAKPRMEVPN